MGETQDEQVTLIGECHGGPLDARRSSSRFPKGFLLVDKQANQAWIYDWNGTAFVCREPEGRAADYARRWEAAESSDWDVLAYDGSDSE